MKTITIKHEIETEIEVSQVSFYVKKHISFSTYYCITLAEDDKCTVTKLSTAGSTSSVLLRKETTNYIPKETHDMLLCKDDYQKITEDEFRAAMNDSLKQFTSDLLTPFN
jgi:hypothetical protein